MIFQEPMTSLDPLWTIGNQLVEPIRRHQRIGARAAEEKALELLRLVRIQNPERRLHSYPHELSGGQRQRVMIAMAIANDPDLLIADEPTTALDVTIQAEILALLRDLQQRLGMSLVFITHDLGIVRRIADRVYVMKSGAVVEEGETDAVFDHPRDPYTAALLAAEPEGRKAPVPRGSPSILEGRKVTVEFELGGGFFRPPVLRAAGGGPRQPQPAPQRDHRRGWRVRDQANRPSPGRCSGSCRRRASSGSRGATSPA